MIFSSITFLFYFLPLVLFIYFLSPGIKAKNITLLIFSLIFYAWGEAELVLLMVISSMSNYFFGIWIDKSRGKTALIVAVVLNILTLVFYKYIGFLAEIIDSIIGTSIHSDVHIHLPIGISFFTFQSISYLIDLHKRTVKLQRSPINMMLYISFFPQLIAGPIVRYIQVEKEITNRIHSLDNFVIGAKRFCIGLAKKVLIANVLGQLSDELMAIPPENSYYAIAWVGIIAYSFQIYFDFSGYSDMAIGLGRIFGFNFPENFNFPYISRSIKEFWRRWHISLSTWFRDYLYIPLGGNKKGLERTYFNLFIVFFITGLWHGATFNFIIWGLFHGVFIVLERLGFERILKRFGFLGHIYTLFIVVMAWVVFKLPTLPEAISFYKLLFTFSPEVYTVQLRDLIGKESAITLLLAVIFSMPVALLASKVQLKNNSVLMLIESSKSVLYIIVFILCIMTLASSTYNPFIYYRF